ncbi:hypothetical protein MGN70_014442 [Eutypa lata]|nr:hypothetical protein MGN70_014442 [Eutypa lata]
MATTTIPAQMENPFVDTQGDVDSVLEPAKVGFKRYSLYYTTSRLDARLHLGSSTSPASYYFESKMALSSPQLFLRRGTDATAPVVNFARLQSTSRHILLGAGSYTKQAAEMGRVAWEELRREKNLMHRSDYHFSTGVADDNNNGKKTAFCWRKNKDRILRTVYECVDENGNSVARLFSGGAFNWRKGGEIDTAEGLSQALEEYLIMSALAVWVMEAFDYQSLLNGYSDSNKKGYDGSKKKD